MQHTRYKMGSQSCKAFFFNMARMIFERTGCACTFVFERDKRYAFCLSTHDLLGPIGALLTKEKVGVSNEHGPS